MTRIAPDWLADPAVGAAMAALAGLSPRFVGGCVRDALMGRAGGDIDLSVAATPEETLRAAEAAGLRALPTGIDHGVVMLIVEGRPFEVASLRRDVATDGRRAVVAWTENLGLDAARRDFTMNALYAEPDGQVLDPTGEGLADLRARRLRFVGDPEARIAEDYLRVLRLFRFAAELGLDEFDPAALGAARAGAAGLGRVSKERIGAEMRKLLAAPDPEPALAAMGPALEAALPGARFGARPFAGLVAAERAAGEAPDALRRLTALGAQDAPRALRLSKAEASRLAAISAALAGGEAPAASAFRFGPEAARDAILLRAARGEAAPEDWRAEIARGAAARLPVAAADLLALGHAPGPALGRALDEAEARWLASGLRAGRAELLVGAAPADGRGR